MSELTERFAQSDAEANALRNKQYWNKRARDRGQEIPFPEIEEKQVVDPMIDKEIDAFATDISELHGISKYAAFVLLSNTANKLAKSVK